MDVEATLGIRVENGQAVRATKELDASLKTLGRTADATLSPFDRMTRKIEESRIKYEAWQRQLAQNQATAVAVTQANTLRVAHEGLAKAKDASTVAANRLRGGFAALTSQMTGMNPAVSSLTSIVGSFAIGSPWMIGVLAGVAALAFAWDKLSAGARKIKEDADKAVESIQKMNRLRALGAGAELKMQTSDINREINRQLQIAQQARDLSKVGGMDEVLEKATKEITRLRGVRDSVADDIVRAEAEAENDAWGKWRKGLTDQIEKNKAAYDRMAAAEKAAFEKREQQLKAHIAELNRISGSDFGAGVSFAIEMRLAGKDIGGGQDAFGNIIRAGNADDDRIRAQFDASRAKVDADVKAQEDRKKKATEAAIEATRKHAATMQIAAQAIDGAVSAIVAKVGGSGIGSQFAGGIGRAAASTFGGFGGTVIGQSIFGPIMAGIGSAIGKVFDNIAASFVGQSSEERAKIRATKLAFADMTATMEILRAKSLGLNTALLEAVEANRKYYEGIKAQIDAALPGTKNEAERNARRAEADAFRAKDEERIRAEDARMRREQKEDLQVRLLTAQGKDKEAASLRLALEQQREYAQAVKDGADAAYLATLTQVQAMEKQKEAMNTLATSVRNAPTGFKIESYINRFAAPRPWDYPGGQINTPFRPQGGPTSTSGTRSTVNIGTVSMVIPKGMKPEDVGPAFMKFLTKVAGATVGHNVPIAEALDYAPTS